MSARGSRRGLVIGAGSIGLQHHAALVGLGIDSAVVSRRRPAALAPAVESGDRRSRVFPDVPTALRQWHPSHVVVASETSRHVEVLEELARSGFEGSVIVEKPVSDRPTSIRDFPFKALVVGYQLRLHPAVTAAREMLESDPVIVAAAHVGKHLAAWRPGRAIGDTASARAGAGGGVLRDLSHELDLLLSFAGNWQRVCALGGRSGALGPTVTTDDRWALLLELDGGAVASVTMDALDRCGQRRMTFTTAGRTVLIDLVSNTLHACSGTPDEAVTSERKQQWEVQSMDLLSRMHELVLADALDRLCSFTDGLMAVDLIGAVERSALEGRWVSRAEVRA